MYHLCSSHPHMSHLPHMSCLHMSHLHTSHLCTSHLCTIVHNEAGSYTVLEVSLLIPGPDLLPTHSIMLRGMLLTPILMRMILSFVMVMAMDKVRAIASYIIQSNITSYRFPCYGPLLSCSRWLTAVQMVSIPRQSGKNIWMTINQMFCSPNHVDISNGSSLQLTVAPVFTSTTESYAHLGTGIRCFSTQLQSIPLGPCVNMWAGSKTTTAADHRWWKYLVSQWNQWCDCKGNGLIPIAKHPIIDMIVGHSQPRFSGGHDVLSRGYRNSALPSLAWWQDGFRRPWQSSDSKHLIWWGDLLRWWTCKVC